MARPLGGMLLPLLPLFLWPQAAFCQTEALNTIIDNVRANEELYKNLDAILHDTYNQYGESPFGIGSTDTDTHVVLQDGLFF